MDVEKRKKDDQDKMKPNEEFRKGCDEFINSCITLVYQQHSHGNTDHIDNIVHRQNVSESEKKCKECGCEADISYRSCGNCGGKVTRISLDDICLSGEGKIIKNKSQKIKCVVGEPDFINPNSFKNIMKVLQ